MALVKRKKSKKTSPLQRSKKLLESEGYTVAIVERWNPWAKVRQDLFGIIDLLAIKPGRTLGVQVTTLSHKQPHIDKIKTSPYFPTLQQAGWTIVLHSWRELKDGWKVDLEDFNANNKTN